MLQHSAGSVYYVLSTVLTDVYQVLLVSDTHNERLINMIDNILVV